MSLVPTRSHFWFEEEIWKGTGSILPKIGRELFDRPARWRLYRNASADPRRHGRPPHGNARRSSRARRALGLL